MLWTVVFEDSGIFECSCMLYVCVGCVMDVVFSVCTVSREAVGARQWEV